MAAVIDPGRDVEIYLTMARERGLRITHAIETHIHADFVSGVHEREVRPAAEHLFRLGYDHAAGYLPGSMTAWKAADLPLQKAANREADDG